jgi:hypothetical protein
MPKGIDSSMNKIDRSKLRTAAKRRLFDGSLNGE